MIIRTRSITPVKVGFKTAKNKDGSVVFQPLETHGGTDFLRKLIPISDFFQISEITLAED